MSALSPNRPLLVLALAGADGSVIQTLLDEGRLPHLLALVERGTMAQTVWAPPGPAIGQWLTLATGQPAFVHGVPTTPVPRLDGYGATLPERATLKVAPLWERLAATGRRTAAVNWPATHATPLAERLPLTVAADTFFYMEGQSPANWPAFPESVAPRLLTADLLGLRVHAADLPRAARPSRLGDGDVTILQVLNDRAWLALSGLESAVAVAGRFLPAAAAFVFLDFLEMIGLPRSRQEVDAVLAGYRLLDAAVGRLVAGAGAEADIAVVTRPPSIALDGLAPAEAPKGLAVFVSPEHARDALGPDLEPQALAAALERMALGDAPPAALLEAGEESAEALAAALAGRYTQKTPAMKRDALALDAARFQVELETLRSRAHAQADSGLAMEMSQSPQARLAAAEKLWRDGAAHKGLALLDGNDWPPELAPWRDRLRSFLAGDEAG